MAPPIASAFAAGLLAVLLAASSIAKLRDLNAFMGILSGYGALPRRMSRAIGYAVPVYEAFLAVGLVSGATRAIAGILAAAFFTGTAGVVGMSLMLHRAPERCGCFGSASTSKPAWSLVGLDVTLARQAYLPSLTADFAYARRQRSAADIPTGYAAPDLDHWAEVMKAWAADGEPDGLPRFDKKKAAKKKRNVFAFVISGAKERAPAGAMALIERL